MILAAFLLVFAVEMVQDFGKVPYYEKVMKENCPFDPETQTAILRISVCDGEKIAGFKERDGHFTEVMVIRSSEEEQRFLKRYGLEELKKEY